jgi:hypothetical protein
MEERTWRGPAAKKLFCGFALRSSPPSIMKQQWAVEGEREEKKLKSFRNFALSLSLSSSPSQSPYTRDESSHRSRPPTPPDRKRFDKAFELLSFSFPSSLFHSEDSADV